MMIRSQLPKAQAVEQRLLGVWFQTNSKDDRFTRSLRVNFVTFVDLSLDAKVSLR